MVIGRNNDFGNVKFLIAYRVENTVMPESINKLIIN